MVTRTTKTLLAGVTVLAIAGVGSGIAYAQSTDPSPAPSNSAPVTSVPGNASSAPAKAAKHSRAFLSRVEHGEFTARVRAGERVLDVQRGTVTAVNAQSISVQSPDGFSASYAVDSQAKIRKNKQSATIDQVAVNDRVMVVAVKNGTTVTVKRISDAGPGK
ncbi:MAG TPA: hypothetical protein VGJ13_21695 [Pseudonocardiaceae bacterium]